jgi:hypothetical protein
MNHIRRPSIFMIAHADGTWHVSVVEGQSMRCRPRGMRAGEWCNRIWWADRRSLWRALWAVTWQFYTSPPHASAQPAWTTKGNNWPSAGRRPKKQSATSGVMMHGGKSSG